MDEKVVVYIDHENMRGTALNEFGDLRDRGRGSFWPHLLADEVTRLGGTRSLSGVRVYRGEPDPERDPETHRVFEAQRAEWEARADDVEIITRPLQYGEDDGHPPVEKGIDVALAVDLYRGAVKGWYDVAVVCSRDTDLAPAIEAVRGDFGHRIVVELAAWGRSRACPIPVPGPRMWCHWLDGTTYDRVADRSYYGPLARVG